MCKDRNKFEFYIAPGFLYPLRSFQTLAGISATRIREARCRGIHLRTLNVGRRKFVRGTEAIDFIERLATATSFGTDRERTLDGQPDKLKKGPIGAESSQSEFNARLYANRQSGMTWKAILEAAQENRDVSGWTKISTITGIRSRIQRYAKAHNLPLRKGIGGRPRDKL